MRMSSAAVALLPLALLVAGCGSSDDATGSGTEPTASASTSPTEATSTPASGGACNYPAFGTAAKKVKPPEASPTATEPVEATIETSQGDIPVTLAADKAPCTVNSFLSLADQGYFDDTTCHRLTTSGIYVLQCGDPTGTGSGGPGYQFGDELIEGDARVEPCRKVETQAGKQEVCTYPAGTLAMANAGPDTNGSQFFLVYQDSPLPNAYTVFGRMDASGLKTVRTIAKKGLAAGSQGDGAPKDEVEILSVESS